MQMKTEFLKDFVNGTKERGLNVRGIVVRQHGKIIDQHDIVEPVERIQLFSASKTFTSMAIGIAQGEGRLSINDKFVDLMKGEYDYDLPENFDKITVRNLLTMCTGHSTCPVSTAQNALREKMKAEGKNPAQPVDGNHMSDLWFDAFMKTPLEHDPDEYYFAYNNGATYMLSIIIQKLTGENLRDYLMPRIFDPLELENPHWDNDRKGRALGAIGLYLTTEELSRGGQLLLNGGVWNDKQLVPTDYVKAMTAKQVDNKHCSEDNEANCGYGYQMWKCTYPESVRFDGALGQYSILLPTLDAVVTITSAQRTDALNIVRLVWDTITPKLEQMM